MTYQTSLKMQFVLITFNIVLTLLHIQECSRHVLIVHESFATLFYKIIIVMPQYAERDLKKTSNTLTETLIGLFLKA